MHDIMLFGEGWDGEVRQVEQGAIRHQYIPHPQDPHLRAIEFIIKEYISDDGEMYLVGYVDREPLMQDVAEAIMRYRPTPV
ncbi:hypothetical protein CWC46_14265 [Prodigiosinella confusarubida]|uniref:Uncharacterized protein n=1 Tax=Serratia sp. (strain ATCC 39006) TaxID=104623 RepID=A0A2I5T8H0_SERS3|nr:hypothetical protein [Serratia sp. ATCC 39006]AUH00870.1 hypothetical protein CWC46_14265 [Serratia sp. ATCC 39006]AUH05192.1 hypothetical protein Ser39006_014270 [Serratia sp. ATCC 39006]